jgi:hypothetical protein
MTNPQTPEPDTRLTYFQLAKANAGKLIQITENDYYYMRDVLPPVYGKGCFAMGEIANHTAQDHPIYYWTAEREGKYFCFYGTQDQAEKQFQWLPATDNLHINLTLEELSGARSLLDELAQVTKHSADAEDGNRLNSLYLLVEAAEKTAAAQNQQSSEAMDAVNTIEPATKLVCPKCQNEDQQEFRYLDNPTHWREIVEVRPGQLLVEGLSNQYGESEDCNDRIECRSCYMEFPIPNGFTADFV